MARRPSYPECWLDTFFLHSTELGVNGVNPDLISLFRAADKVVVATPYTNLPSCLHHYYEADEEDSDLPIVFYEVPIAVVRDRLDVIGYTLDTSRMAFQEWIHAELKQTNRRMEEGHSTNDNYKDFLKQTCHILSTLSVETWMEGLKVIWNLGLKPNKRSQYTDPYKDTLVGYMLSNDLYGLPGYDICILLRLSIAALEVEETGKTLVYDLAPLTWYEDFNYEEDFIQNGLDAYTSEYNLNSKTIVLTEGKTDAWILEQSLRILYPHLHDYYSFLDFDTSSIGGGVGNLANMVKAFAGAGIVNNIIALFDNDTAAAAACKSLSTLKLPPNIVICRLPELNFLKNYPTIGPSGEVNLDVNGIAASIELYLGEDILKLDGQRLTPVQWTGYDRGVNKYQGEVLAKDELHRRFRHKVANWQGELGNEWDGLRAIFNVTFSAFEDEHRRIICQRPSTYYER